MKRRKVSKKREKCYIEACPNPRKGKLYCGACAQAWYYHRDDTESERAEWLMRIDRFNSRANLWVRQTKRKLKLVS